VAHGVDSEGDTAFDPVQYVAPLRDTEADD
jgi:hypothetical protein